MNNPFARFFHSTAKKVKRKKRVSVRELGAIGTPAFDDPMQNTDVQLPRHYMSIRQIGVMFELSDIAQIILRSLEQEIFRNGIGIDPRFSFKCSNGDCGKEFTEWRAYCDDCGSRVRTPRWEEKKSLRKWRDEPINAYGQMLIDVMREAERDLNKYDNAFIQALKSYQFNDAGKLVGASVDEVLRASPNWMRKLYSNNGMSKNDKNEWLYVCVEHRSKVETTKVRKPMRCPVCGREMFLAEFYSRVQDGKDMVYYPKGEICHLMKYEPTAGYGRSRMLVIWQKLLTLYQMDRYIYKMFSLQRNPKALLFIKGKLDHIRKSWLWMKNMARENPNMVYPVAVDTSMGDRGGQIAQYVDLAIDFGLIQYIEMREEYRRIIGMVYGVSPIFQGDMSQGGGLNNEGLQITVTNRAIQNGQRVWNDIFFRWFNRQLGVEDMILALRPNEEKDLKAGIERENMRVQLGMAVKNLGYDVDVRQGEDGIAIEVGEKQKAPEGYGTSAMGGAIAGGLNPASGGYGDSGRNEGSPDEKGEKPAWLKQYENEPDSDFLEAHKGLVKELQKSKHYLKPGENAPKGVEVKVGPKGGKYYEGKGKMAQGEGEDFTGDILTDSEVGLVSGVMKEDWKRAEKDLIKFLPDNYDYWEDHEGKLDEAYKELIRAHRGGTIDVDGMIQLAFLTGRVKKNGDMVDKDKAINLVVSSAWNRHDEIVGKYGRTSKLIERDVTSRMRMFIDGEERIKDMKASIERDRGILPDDKIAEMEEVLAQYERSGIPFMKKVAPEEMNRLSGELEFDANIQMIENRMEGVKDSVTSEVMMKLWNSGEEGRKAIMATMHYTEEYYSDINDAMRSGTAHEDKIIEANVNSLRYAVAHGIDTSSRKLYRGIHGRRMMDDLLPRIQRGYEASNGVILKGFTSTTEDIDVAVFFASMHKDSTAVLLEIESFDGMPIDGMSDAPNEKEVLLDAGERYEIVSYEDYPVIDTANGEKTLRARVKLRQMGNNINKELQKSKHYLKPGEKAPEGVITKVGPHGGKYYEGNERHPQKPKEAVTGDNLTESEVDMVSKVMINDPGKVENALENCKKPYAFGYQHPWVEFSPELNELYRKLVKAHADGTIDVNGMIQLAYLTGEVDEYGSKASKEHIVNIVETGVKRRYEDVVGTWKNTIMESAESASARMKIFLRRKERIENMEKAIKYDSGILPADKVAEMEDVLEQYKKSDIPFADEVDMKELTEVTAELGFDVSERHLKYQMEMITDLDASDIAMKLWNNGREGKKAMLAMMHYTQEYHKYINAYLRGNGIVNVREIDTNIEGLRYAMNYARKVDKKLYRGISGDEMIKSLLPKIRKAFASGDTITLEGFISTSESMDVAMNFARLSGKTEENGVLLEIEPMKGVPIDGMSDVAREKETLLDAGKKYEVVSIEDHGKVEGWYGTAELLAKVKLREVK